MLQQHLSDKVDHWTALRYLAEASKYAEGGVLAETFAGIVAPYFHQVIERHREMILMLPIETFSMLVCHEALAVREEVDLYQVIISYIDRDHEPPLDEETLNTLLNTIEFSDLNSVQLAEANSSPL